MLTGWKKEKKTREKRQFSTQDTSFEVAIIKQDDIVFDQRQ